MRNQTVLFWLCQVVHFPKVYFFLLVQRKKKKKDGYESDVERDKEEGRERDF